MNKEKEERTIGGEERSENYNEMMGAISVMIDDLKDAYKNHYQVLIYSQGTYKGKTGYVIYLGHGVVKIRGNGIRSTIPFSSLKRVEVADGVNE